MSLCRTGLVLVFASVFATGAAFGFSDPCTNDTQCSDGQYCTGVELCVMSKCAPGTPPNCNDGNVCTNDACNEGIDACTHSNNGNVCNDGNQCTAADVCFAGVCVGNPVGNGTPCGNPSNTACDNPDTCQSGVCQPNYVPNGTGCDDGLFCTVSDICGGGVCAGSPRNCGQQVCKESTDQCVDCLTQADCDDSNPCTDDACLLNSCFHNNNSNACDDGLFCTETDVCAGGSCGGAGDPCAGGEFCNEGSNACVPLYEPGSWVTPPGAPGAFGVNSFADISSGVDALRGSAHGVYLHSGEVTEAAVDLYIPGRDSFVGEIAGDLLRPSGRGDSFVLDIAGGLLRSSGREVSFVDGISTDLFRSSGGGNSFVGDISTDLLRPSGGGSSIADTLAVIQFRPTQNPLVFARKYRSRVGPTTAMGNGSDFSYNIYIEQAGADIVVHDGWSRSDVYEAEGLQSHEATEPRSHEGEGTKRVCEKGYSCR